MLRIQRTLTTLQDAMKATISTVESVWWMEGDYKNHREIMENYSLNPPESKRLPHYFFANNQRFCFGQTIELPPFDPEFEYFIEVSTGREGQWDAVNPQLLVYLNGEIACGLDTNHRMVYIDPRDIDSFESGQTIDFAAHLYTGMSEGDLGLRVKLVKVNLVLKRAYYDLLVLHDAILAQMADRQNATGLLQLVKNAIYSVNFGPNPEDLIAGAKTLSHILRTTCYGNEGLLPYTVHAVGHTHIDVAWLWELRQTREKVTRSYATALNLQNRYPFYRFMASQPVLYEMLEEGHPELLQQVKEASKQGKWESEGAMYLEADCNLSGGESLIRQIEHGQRYFKEAFGKESKGLWLPDVFGYSAALPQILKLSGIEWFVTSKISWNDTNKLPYDSFLWKGIDESTIPTQFITTISMETLNRGEFKSIYEGNMTPTEILGSVRRHQQSEVQPNVIMPYGYGDGGGGATDVMLETLERLSMGIKGMPRVIASDVNAFFKAYHQTPSNQLPIWSGELYLEYHRGTYTTNGFIKQKHRTLENKLLQLEKLHAYQTVNDAVNGRRVGTGGEADFSPLNLTQEWRTLLLNEFHDILPGTSIETVYDEAYRQLDDAIESVDCKVRDILNQVPNLQSQYVLVSSSQDDCSGSFIFRDDLKLFKEGVVIDAETVKVERIDEVYCCAYLSHLDKLGPFEARPVDLLLGRLHDRNCTPHNMKVYDFTNFEVTFNDRGDIDALYDKNNKRSVLKANGVGLKVNAYEDRPMRWDAWDIDADYRQFPLAWDEHIGFEYTSGVVADQVKITKKLSASTVTFTYLFYREEGNNRIDVVFDVDWHNHQVLLKFEGDFEIHAPFATYDIQFGQVNRPNDHNNTYHQAMFEVCAQHWGKLSEAGYSITMMSNDKFGYHAYQNQMGITLLKSPTWPNPNSDQGNQHFSIALLCAPQCGLSDLDTHKEAMKFCEPPRLYQTSQPKAIDDAMRLTRSVWKVAFDWFAFAENITLESMRITGSNCLELRLCERHNKRGSFKLKQRSGDDSIIKAIQTCQKMDLRGEALLYCDRDESGFDVPYRPFEIITLKLIF